MSNRWRNTTMTTNTSTSGVEEELLTSLRKELSMANINSTSLTSSLSKLQSLNGLFAIYKKPGPTSADVLNKLKKTLLKGNPQQPSHQLCLWKLTRGNVTCDAFTEAGVQNPNPRKRKKQEIKMGHGGTLDSAASGVLGELRAFGAAHVLGQTQGCCRSNFKTLSRLLMYFSQFRHWPSTQLYSFFLICCMMYFF